MKIPDHLKSCNLIKSPVLKYWDCNLEGEGISTIGPHHVCVLKNGKIIAYDGGGIFGKEKVFSLTINNKRDHVFAIQTSVGPKCFARFGSVKASFDISDEDVCADFLRWDDDCEFDMMYCGIYNYQIEGAEESVDYFVRFRVKDEVLYRYDYYTYSTDKPTITRLLIANLVKINLCKDNRLEINGPFIDDEGDLWDDGLVTSFEALDCSILIDAINKVSSGKPIPVLDDNIAPAIPKNNSYRDTVHIYGFIKGSNISATCMVDFSEGISVHDAKTGSLIVKIHGNQLEAAEIYDSSLLIVSGTSRFSLNFKKQIVSISDRTKVELFDAIYSSRRKTPIVGLLTGAKDELNLEPVVLSAQDGIIKAKCVNQSCNLTRESFLSAKLNDAGQIQIEQVSPEGAFIFSEHAFSFATYNTCLPVIREKVLSLDISKQRFKWTGLFSGYLCYHLFGDIIQLLKKVEKAKDVFDKAVLLKYGLEGIRKQAFTLEHIFPIHLANSGLLWASELGVEGRSIISEKMSIALNSGSSG